jgi:MraZ protein
MGRMNPSFRGRFTLKLDPKGRLSLPPAIRASLPNSAAQVVITNSRYQNLSCLHVYSLTQWQELERKIGKLSSLDPNVQAFQRFYLSGGQVIEVDTQNRIVIPQSLRRFAGLDSTAIVVGMSEKFEIWSEQNWSGIFSNLTENFEETMAKVSELQRENADDGD